MTITRRAARRLPRKESASSPDADARRVSLNAHRRRHEALAGKLLAGLLANPDVTRLDGGLFHGRGIGLDHGEKLVRLAFSMAGELMRMGGEA